MGGPMPDRKAKIRAGVSMNNAQVVICRALQKGRER